MCLEIESWGEIFVSAFYSSEGSLSSLVCSETVKVAKLCFLIQMECGHRWHCGSHWYLKYSILWHFLREISKTKFIYSSPLYWVYFFTLKRNDFKPSKTRNTKDNFNITKYITNSSLSWPLIIFFKMESLFILSLQNLFT